MKPKRIVYPMTRDELETLHTKSLLARLKSLHKCEQSFELSDWEDYEIDENADYIQFKESEEWTAQYELLKDILSNREHIPKK